MAMLDRQARNATGIGMDQDTHLVATSQQCAHEVGAYMPCCPCYRYMHCRLPGAGQWRLNPDPN
jgi:hypothetical protein